TAPRATWSVTRPSSPRKPPRSSPPANGSPSPRSKRRSSHDGDCGRPAPVRVAVQPAACAHLRRRARGVHLAAVHPHGNENLAHAADAPWLFVVLLPLLLAVLLCEITDGSIDAKAVAVLGVLV